VKRQTAPLAENIRNQWRSEGLKNETPEPLFTNRAPSANGTSSGCWASEPIAEIYSSLMASLVVRATPDPFF
jgi:hypothetical protein